MPQWECSVNDALSYPSARSKGHPAYVPRLFPLLVSSTVFGFGNVLVGFGGIGGNVLGGYSKSLSGSLNYVYLGAAAATVHLLIIIWRLDDDRLRQ